VILFIGHNNINDIIYIIRAQKSRESGKKVIFYIFLYLFWAEYSIIYITKMSGNVLSGGIAAHFSAFLVFLEGFGGDLSAIFT